MVTLRHNLYDLPIRIKPLGHRYLLAFLKKYLIGLNGRKGLQGDQGPQGEKGPTGQIGNQGPRGDQGAKGKKGEPGDQIKGPQGMQGEMGIEGIKGEQGRIGNKGKAGPVGPSGIDGKPGQNNTVQGIAGEDGIQGPKGLKGNSPKGAQGERGKSIQGIQGLPGIKGMKGIRGRPGPQGIQGERVDGAPVNMDKARNVTKTIIHQVFKSFLNGNKTKDMVILSTAHMMDALIIPEKKCVEEAGQATYYCFDGDLSSNECRTQQCAQSMRQLECCFKDQNLQLDEQFQDRLIQCNKTFDIVMNQQCQSIVKTSSTSSSSQQSASTFYNGQRRLLSKQDEIYPKLQQTNQAKLSEYNFEDDVELLKDSFVNHNEQVQNNQTVKDREYILQQDKHEDLVQKSETTSQQSENISQQSENISQQSENVSQQSENVSQQSENVSQQKRKLSKESETMEKIYIKPQEQNLIEKTSIQSENKLKPLQTIELNKNLDQNTKKQFDLKKLHNTHHQYRFQKFKSKKNKKIKLKTLEKSLVPNFEDVIFEKKQNHYFDEYVPKHQTLQSQDLNGRFSEKLTSPLDLQDNKTVSDINTAHYKQQPRFFKSHYYHDKQAKHEQLVNQMNYDSHHIEDKGLKIYEDQKSQESLPSKTIQNEIFYEQIKNATKENSKQQSNNLTNLKFDGDVSFDYKFEPVLSTTVSDIVVDDSLSSHLLKQDKNNDILFQKKQPQEAYYPLEHQKSTKKNNFLTENQPSPPAQIIYNSTSKIDTPISNHQQYLESVKNYIEKDGNTTDIDLDLSEQNKKQEEVLQKHNKILIDQAETEYDSEDFDGDLSDSSSMSQINKEEEEKGNDNKQKDYNDIDEEEDRINQDKDDINNESDDSVEEENVSEDKQLDKNQDNEDNLYDDKDETDDSYVVHKASAPRFYKTHKYYQFQKDQEDKINKIFNRAVKLNKPYDDNITIFANNKSEILPFQTFTNNKLHGVIEQAVQKSNESIENRTSIDFRPVQFDDFAKRDYQNVDIKKLPINMRFKGKSSNQDVSQLKKIAGNSEDESLIDQYKRNTNQLQELMNEFNKQDKQFSEKNSDKKTDIEDGNNYLQKESNYFEQLKQKYGEDSDYQDITDTYSGKGLDDQINLDQLGRDIDLLGNGTKKSYKKNKSKKKQNKFLENDDLDDD